MTDSSAPTRSSRNPANETKDYGRGVRSRSARLVSALGPARGVGRALILAFALLYLLTLDTGLRPGELEGGDLITHQYAQVQARPSNAPGYPLYTIGGWLWFRLGRLILGQAHNPIPILSSYSTLWALLTLWLLYRLILEVTTRERDGNWLVAALVTAFYGVTYFFWYYAVTTEQYTSAVAWTLAVVLLAFRWERTQRDGYLLAIAFLGGVGLAHMVTVLFVIPPLLWLVLRREPGLLRRPKLIAAALGLAALPLLSYIYVYVRGAQHPEWRGAGQWTSTWQWFWSFISTRQGRDELTWSLTPFLTAEFPSLIWGELTWPGLVAGLVGIGALRSPAPAADENISPRSGRSPDRARRGMERGGWVADRPQPAERAVFRAVRPGSHDRASLIYATLGIYLAFCWIDRLGNWYQVIMPAYALLALGLAAGIDRLWRGVGARRRASRKTQSAIRFSLLLSLLILLLYRGSVSHPRADSHDRPEDTGLVPGWAILADAPPTGTAILGALPEALALNYLTEIWGERPDLRSVTSAQARDLLVAGEPLAVTSAALSLVPAEVSPDAHYSALGRTLIAVRAAPSMDLPAELRGDLQPGLQPWTHDFGAGLKLVGGRTTQTRRVFENRSGLAEIVVTLVWQATVTPDRDWSVSVRLTQGGQEIAQLDRRHPVDGAYPMTRWSPGEVVADAYPFVRPAGAQPDGVRVILYRQTADGGYVNLDAAEFAFQSGSFSGSG